MENRKQPRRGGVILMGVMINRFPERHASTRAGVGVSSYSPDLFHAQRNFKRHIKERKSPSKKVRVDSGVFRRPFISID